MVEHSGSLSRRILAVGPISGSHICVVIPRDLEMDRSPALTQCPRPPAKARFSSERSPRKKGLTPDLNP